MTFDEAKQELSRKLGIDYFDIDNNGLFSETDLEAWINSGAKRAWDYKPWDFAEGDKKITSEDSEYYDYPADFKTGSINLLLVDGKEYRKLSYQDYMRYKANYPSGDDKVWAERKRYYFVNQNAYTVGAEISVFGKLRFQKITDGGDLMPFSPDEDDQESSGNQAAVLLAYAEALSSEKKKNPAQAATEEKRAFAILDNLWLPFAQQQGTQQTDRPFFDVPDFFGESNNSTIIGNFN